MHRTIGALAVMVALGSIALGCKDEKANVEPPKTTADTTPTIAPVKPTVAASAAMPAPSGSAAMGKMANCPNAVEGSTTKFNDVPGGVEIIVTATSEAAIKEIRTRAKHIAEVSKEESDTVKHNGSGLGGGQYGRCPVVGRNTTVESADTVGGTKITVKPKNASEVDWVRREARERYEEFNAPGGKDAGQGKMAHCPSAAPGAVTAIKDAKEGIVVTVTSKEEGVVKDIRDRGKHLLDAAKKDPKDVKHQGDGSGGGAVGRCPVVVKDTKVEGKDVPGGMEFTVKPEKLSELTALKKEARERAESLSPGPLNSAAPAAGSAAPAAGSAKAAPLKAPQ